MVTVKGNHPLAEVISRKLFSIETCPKNEQRRMVNRACKSAVEWYEENVKVLKEKAWMYDNLCK